ncbi:MAG: histidine kinase [Rikenellaceae bacterium]
MKLGKKEFLMGVLFALFIAIFINYNTLERLFEVDKEGLKKMLPPLIFSVVWFFLASIIYYVVYVVISNMLHKRNNSTLTVVSTVLASFVVTYAFFILYPMVRDLVLVDVFNVRRPPNNPNNRVIGVVRGLSSSQFMHLLLAILNLLFVYIQRLLYRNQEIEMRNEQLQLESVKSQHSALIQQINPHFFFNSLGSLRYIIMKGDVDNAVDFLDNLTVIFRKTLKMSGNTLHSLQEEVELTISYIHIIEKRFEGKIFVEFQIGESFEKYMLSPLSLLTLMENVVKHNTLSIKKPVRVKVYTTPDKDVVVENNIVHKFEEVECNGIGLINLNKQYQLLTGRGVVVESNDDVFRVKLPLVDVSTTKL